MLSYKTSKTTLRLTICPGGVLMELFFWNSKVRRLSILSLLLTRVYVDLKNRSEDRVTPHLQKSSTIYLLFLRK